jgi:hypothetical protein
VGLLRRSIRLLLVAALVGLLSAPAQASGARTIDRYTPLVQVHLDLQTSV